MTMRALVPGDLYDIDGRLREYDPDLSLRYDGDGRWSVMHEGRQGRPYVVLTIGEGCGNRWPKGDLTAPEVDRPDMRVLYLVRAADIDAQGGADRAVTEMELRELVAKEAQRRQFANKVEDVARDVHKAVVREHDGMPDLRLSFPAAKVGEAS